eukprot:scaffold191_cov375-Pinguiococcus_pyrenoidosus.AAC.3
MFRRSYSFLQGVGSRKLQAQLDLHVNCLNCWPSPVYAEGLTGTLECNRNSATPLAERLNTRLQTWDT